MLLDLAQALSAINCASAVRQRARELLALADADALTGFRVARDELPKTTELIVTTIRTRYPHLRIPFHSRWRHFEVDGIDRWDAHAQRECAGDAMARARASIDLAVTSVLLDAGAGPHWRYTEANGRAHARSEGLAVASLDMFVSGLFSAEPASPLQAHAQALEACTATRIGEAMQVTAANPMVGLEGRAGLMRALAKALRARPDYFGAETPRPGHLVDYFVAQAPDKRIAAADLLRTVLDGFGSIWPGRERLGDVVCGYASLGDVWRHSAIQREDMTNALMPLHKLSQWLTYSLLEPLQACGFEITGLDELTGLAEYRNGGLLVDTGVLVARDSANLSVHHAPGAEFIVEWRGLTVALLDELAVLVRQSLGLDQHALPLASVLEGGTWAAGRIIAGRLRADGGPPVHIESDGTVF